MQEGHCARDLQTMLLYAAQRVQCHQPESSRNDESGEIHLASWLMVMVPPFRVVMLVNKAASLAWRSGGRGSCVPLQGWGGGGGVRCEGVPEVQFMATARSVGTTALAR